MYSNMLMYCPKNCQILLFLNLHLHAMDHVGSIALVRLINIVT